MNPGPAGAGAGPGGGGPLAAAVPVVLSPAPGPGDPLGAAEAARVFGHLATSSGTRLWARASGLRAAIPG